MARHCTFLFGALYAGALGLAIWYCWGWYQFWNAIPYAPMAVAALLGNLALYCWLEWVAIRRRGRARFRLTITLPLALLLASVSVAAVWPQRRVTSATRTLEDLRIIDAAIDAELQNSTPAPATPPP